MLKRMIGNICICRVILQKMHVLILPWNDLFCTNPPSYKYSGLWQVNSYARHCIKFYFITDLLLHKWCTHIYKVRSRDKARQGQPLLCRWKKLSNNDKWLCISPFNPYDTKTSDKSCDYNINHTHCNCKGWINTWDFSNLQNHFASFHVCYCT